MLTFLVLLISILFILISKRLLLSLLLLEMLAFLILSEVCLVSSPSSSSDFLMILLFSVFVMEGVIALAGLISLVTTTGSDFISSSSMLKC